MILMSVTLYFDQLSANRVAIVRGFHMPQLAQLTDQLTRPIFLAIGIAFLWLWLGTALSVHYIFWALTLAAGLNYILGQTLMNRVSPAAFLAAKPATFRKDWVRSAAILATSSGMIVLNAYIDILFLSIFVRQEAIGLYRVAAQVGLLAGLAYMALNFIAAPNLASLQKQIDRKSLQEQASFYARLSLIAAVPLPIVLWFEGEAIIAFVFGHEFLPALPAMLLLCLVQMVYAIIGMPNMLLVMHNMEKLVFHTTLLTLGINATLCIILIPIYGILGAALASFGATIFWNLMLYYFCWTKIGIDTSVFGLNISSSPYGGA